MTLADPISDLVVCRQRLDVLEQQAKAAEAHDSNWRGVWQSVERGCRVGPCPGAALVATWSPAAVLALCGWIRQTLDGAEAALQRHWQVDYGAGPTFCNTDRHDWPCSDYRSVESVITGLAAVLAPEQAVKP